jgi:hypothetical protein
MTTQSLKQQCISLLIIGVQVNSSKYFFIVDKKTLFACYAHTPSGQRSQISVALDSNIIPKTHFNACKL